MTTEQLILANLIHNEPYTRKVLPYLKAEYFVNEGDRKAFVLIDSYVGKYNKIPTQQALTIDLQKEVDTINQHSYNATVAVIDSLEKPAKNEQQWLLDTTEDFCKEKAVYCGIMTSLDIIEDKSGKKSRGIIPKILSDALAVSFDNHIGHDFLEDYMDQFNFYHAHEIHIPFDIDLLNTITKGGVVRKTLNCFMAPTGIGKTLVMCHLAGQQFLRGFNVLYITLEMSEQKIRERIDANLLDIPLDMLDMMSQQAYHNKIDAIKKNTNARLIIHEYPTAGAGSTHFRHLLNELKLKKNFKPDIVYVDYLNICISSRLRLGNAINSYLYVKNIAEELRGLAVEQNIAIMTATQTNREGASSSDFDMTNTSESFAVPMTLDLMIAIQSSEELADCGQYYFRQLKNRYSDVNKNRKFLVGVDYNKMRLYNVEERTSVPSIEQPIHIGAKTFDKSMFENFK